MKKQLAAIDETGGGKQTSLDSLSFASKDKKGRPLATSQGNLQNEEVLEKRVSRYCMYITGCPEANPNSLP